MKFPRVIRLFVLALASLGASACLAQAGASRGWTALGPGPCGVVDDKAYCLDVLSPHPWPRVVGAQVTQVHGGSDVVCGTTPAASGVCGDATTTARGVRVIDAVRSIAGVFGSGIWCATLLNGGVRCGKIETLIEAAHPPTQPPGLPDNLRFVEAVGGLASCARAENGQVWCWGASRAGELGRGEAHDSSAAPIAGGHHYQSLASGERAWCGIVVDGSVRCWGDGRFELFRGAGPLDRCVTGNGDPFPCAKTPRLIPLPGAARQVAVAAAGTCALITDARVVCWASRFHEAVSPVRGLPAEVVEIAVGGTHGCGRTGAGELWCWSLTGRERLARRLNAP